jgi:hypothetical protein
MPPLTRTSITRAAKKRVLRRGVGVASTVLKLKGQLKNDLKPD